jgi:hypothetical protein
VPVYLFEGLSRNERKQKADKWGRHNLCNKCHDIYEGTAFKIAVWTVSSEQRDKMKEAVKSFAQSYFKKEEKINGDTTKA